MSPLPSEYPWPAFHFKVVFDPRSLIFDTSFQEVSGIGSEIETEPLVEGGENRFVHQLPKGVKHPNLVLKRGLAGRTSQLVRWCLAALEGGLSKPIEPQMVFVMLMNEKSIPLAIWSFANAYPVHWETEGLNSMKNDLAIEKIELVYSYSIREQ